MDAAMDRMQDDGLDWLSADGASDPPAARQEAPLGGANLQATEPIGCGMTLAQCVQGVAMRLCVAHGDAATIAATIAAIQDVFLTLRPERWAEAVRSSWNIVGLREPGPWAVKAWAWRLGAEGERGLPVCPTCGERMVGRLRQAAERRRRSIG